MGTSTLGRTWMRSLAAAAAPLAALAVIAGGPAAGATISPRAVTLGTTDTTPPAPTGTPPQPLFVDDNDRHMLTPRYADAESGVASLDVRYRSAGATSVALSAWQYPSAWRSLGWDGGPVIVSTPRQGTTSCISIRARDASGNVSAWSPTRCATQVWNDTLLVTDPHWTSGAGSVSRYNWGTYFRSSVHGATIYGPTVRARHVGVVVTTCPTCGSLDVYVGRTYVGRISTRSPKVHYHVALALRVPGSTAYGKVRVVVHSRGEQLIVTGLGATIV